MSDANKSHLFNTTGENQYQGLLERVLFSMMIVMPCFVFLCINIIMLFILRSKTVFRETSRYILLYNLLFADTIQIVLGQLLFIFAICRIRLTYPVCGVLTMLTVLATVISPLTLVVMSMERFVAVCYPLRHASIVTVRNTGMVISVLWVIGLIVVLTFVIVMLDFPFEELESLLMTETCSDTEMYLSPRTDDYNTGYTCVLFVSAGVAVTASYTGVMIAARSASTDKASAQKARNTLLLHLVQLGLSMLSTLHASLIRSLSLILSRIIIVRIKSLLYVFVYIFPRCLSTLIYGLRDQTIRQVLKYHLCCSKFIHTKAELT